MDGDALPYQRHGNVGIRSDLETLTFKEKSAFAAGRGGKEQ